MANTSELVGRRKAGLTTPSDIAPDAVRDITGALSAMLADVFTLYLKTKNFHWHMSGPHCRDYHLLLDEHGGQLFTMTDDIAERVRKIGGTTARSVGDIARIQYIQDNDAELVTPADMLRDEKFGVGVEVVVEEVLPSIVLRLQKLAPLSSHFTLKPTPVTFFLTDKSTSICEVCLIKGGNCQPINFATHGYE